MADITNLSNFLGDVADAIRSKKGSEESIPAKNFDEEILSIETGIDTSDADATEENIEKGKTAYVNGLKVTGTLADAGGSADIMVSADNISVGNQRGYDCVSTKYTNSGKKIHRDGWYVNQHMKFEDLAPVLGVTPEKIVEGNTILNIEGTGSGGGIDTSDATATAEDIALGKTAYVKNEKIVGVTEMPTPIYGTGDYFSLSHTSPLGDYPYIRSISRFEDYVLIQYGNSTKSGASYKFSNYYLYKLEQGELVKITEVPSTDHSYYNGYVKIYGRYNDELYIYKLSWNGGTAPSYLPTTKYSLTTNEFSSVTNITYPASTVGIKNVLDNFLFQDSSGRIYSFDPATSTFTKKVATNVEGTYVGNNTFIYTHSVGSTIYSINDDFSVNKLSTTFPNEEYNAKKYNGLTYAKDKLFKGKELYEITSGFIIGDTLRTDMIGNVVYTINDKYYASGSKLYTFDDTSNELVGVVTFSGSITMSGNYLMFKSSDMLSVTILEFDKTNVSIGVQYNGENFYYGRTKALKSEYLLVGKDAYDSNGNAIDGSMPNNGTLSYIPTTAEQTIPKGYTSGGTISAVDANIDSNILPENIKKDVTILGVTGTLEEGSGGSSEPLEGVKLFETIEEMQDDPTAEEGDLALVYGTKVQNAKVDSKFSSAMFPATVVLPTAMTGSANVMYRATDNSVMFDCWGQLSETMFNMSCYSESGEIRIRYTSSDGITYTRTDTTGNPVDFGTEIYYERPEMWNDAIGKFIQVGGNVFEGLYKCSMLTDSRIVIPKLINTNFDAENKRFNVTINESDTIVDTEKLKPIIQQIIQDDNVTGLSCMHLLERSDGIYLGYTTHTNSSGTRYYDYANGVGVTSDGDILNYILGNAWYATGAQNIQYYLFKVDLETMSYNRISIIDAELKHWSSNYTAWFSMDDVVSIPMYIGVSSGDVYLGNFRYETTEAVSAYSLTISNANNLKYTYKGYALAPTQLSATSDYVYKKEFYGKNGVEIGTLGNPDNTLADTNAELYTSIQEKYNNMQPIIVKDGARLDDIKCIPIKYDNTLLIDTSEMTSGRALFMGNNHIKHIPKINTSNMIDIYGMFSDCTAIETIADIDTSSATELTTLFSNCPKLKYIPNIDTSNATSLWMTFAGCETITTVPQLNTNKVTDMRDTFGGCINLIDIPVLDTSSVTQFGSWRYGSTFGNCNSLSNDSLNNILQMCINAVSYTGTKTLKYLGLTQAQATKCTALSNYSAFTSAGWTTGY